MMKVYYMNVDTLLLEIATIALTGPNGERILEIYPELGYITTAEAKERFGVTLQTLDRYRDQYQLPSFKGGRRVYYRLANIQQLIDQAVEEGRPIKFRRINHE